MTSQIPDCGRPIPLDADQIHHGALTLAETCLREQGDARHRTAYYLVMLGLARHEQDSGDIVSINDVGLDEAIWFHPRPERDLQPLTFRVEAGLLDDCR